MGRRFVFPNDYRRETPEADFTPQGEGLSSPCALNAKGLQLSSFALIQVMFQHPVYAAAPRTAPQAFSQFRQILGRARGYDLYIPVLGVAYPAAQRKFVGFAMDKPSKPNSLNSSLDQKM
jgi:hypothetical protein